MTNIEHAQIECTKAEFRDELIALFDAERGEAPTQQDMEIIDGLVRQADAMRGTFRGSNAVLSVDFEVGGIRDEQITIPAVTDAQREQARIAVRGTMRDVRTSLAGMLEGAFTLSPEGLESLAERLNAAAGHLRIAKGE